MDPSSSPLFTRHPNVVVDHKPQSISDMSKGRAVLSSKDQHRHLTPNDGLSSDEYKKPPSLIDVTQNLWYSDQPVEIIVGNDNRGAGVVDQDGGKPLSMGDLTGGREKSRPYDHYYETVKPPSQGDFGQRKHSNNGQGSQDQHRHVTHPIDDNKKPPAITGVAQNQRYSHQPMELLDENDNRRVVVENEDGVRPLSMTDFADGREKSQSYDHHYESHKPLSKGHFGQHNIMSKGRAVLSSKDQHRHLTPNDGLSSDEYKKPPSLIDVTQNLWYSDQPVEIIVGNDNRGAGVVDQDGGKPLSMGDLTGGREKSRPYEHYYETVKPPSQGDFGQRKHSNNGQGSQDQHRHVTRPTDDNKKPPAITGVAQNQRYSHQPMELLDENDNCRVVVENEDGVRPLSMTDFADGREKSQSYDHHYESHKPLSKGHFGQHNIISSGHGVAQNLRYLDQTMDLVAKNNNYEAVVEDQDGGRPLSMTDLADGRGKSQPYDHHYKKDKPMSKRDFEQHNQNSSEHGMAQNLLYSDQQVELLVGNDNREAVVMSQDNGRPLSMADLASVKEKSIPYDHHYEKDKPPSQGDFGQRNHSSIGQVKIPKRLQTPKSYNSSHFDQSIP